MVTKCIKLTIAYCKENPIEKEKFFEELRNLQYRTYLACNRAMTYYYTNDMQNFIQKEIGIPKQDDKSIYGKSFKSFVSNRISETIGTDYTSYATDCISQFVSNRYKNDKKKGLFKGNVSLSEFKRDIPVMLRESKGLGIELQIFSKTKLKEMNMKVGKRIKLLFPKIDNSRKSILINIMSKTYKQGSIQMVYNDRKKKWQVIISYTFEPKVKELNSNRTMGIDLGITNVATMSIYDSDIEEWVKINWKERIINGDELIHNRQKAYKRDARNLDGKELIKYRQKLEKRRKELSIASKWASDNRTGHGYKNRMKSVNSVGDKYNRFKDTFNHKVSRYIVDLAVKYNCKYIQMEDLTGFTEKQTESLLRNWSYYDLQEKIKYKAKENGIEVITINPKYTSKRCSMCGCIHLENRDCKKDQAKFECKVCGYKENADINASKNVSIPGIDVIIKNTPVQS